MGDYLAEKNIPFFLVIGPELYQVKNFKEGYPYHEIHRKLFALYSSKMKVVDPLPTFAYHLQKKPSNYMVTSFDPHRNAEANWVIAAVIAPEIYQIVTGSQYK